VGFLRVAQLGTGSDEPDLKLKTVIKNQAVQSQIDPLIKANLDTAQASEDSISRFLREFSSTAPQVRSQIHSGLDTVSDIYGGGFQSDLDALRMSTSQARMQALQRELARAAARDKAYAAATGLPGRSSYRDLMEARLTGELADRTALEDSQLARDDYLRVMAAKLGNLGTGAGALQTLSSVEGMPTTVSAALRGIPASALAQLMQMDEANKFYSLYRERSGLEKAADADDEFWHTIGQLASIAGSVYGMAGGGGMGGGGGGAVRTPASNFGPVPSVAPSGGYADGLGVGYSLSSPPPSSSPGGGYASGLGISYNMPMSNDWSSMSFPQQRAMALGY